MTDPKPQLPPVPESVVDLLNRRPESPQRRGRVFERLLKAVFERHPGEYGPQRFARVWLWSEWPDRQRLGYGADVGIDLVAEQTEAWGGGLCAIQAKLHGEQSPISKAAVDSFLSASAAECFTSRLLVVTAELGVNAALMVSKAQPRCEVLHAAQLDAWPVDWAACIDRPSELRFAAMRHEPKPYQAEAVNSVVAKLAASDRGKLILPCGTGKSVVALWIAERMAGPGGRVLYLVPSIALMGQTMREWAAQRDPRIAHRYIGVCSDTRAGRNDEDADLAELAMPVTTDPDRVAAALVGAGPAGENGTGVPGCDRAGLGDIGGTGAMTVLFCTYQSLAVVEAAQTTLASNDAARFDLAVCDEAHRTTGVHEAEAGSHFTLIHDPDRIAAAKRLYMTATPRVYTDRVRAKAAAHSRDFDVYSMDDETVYGPELYRMGFGTAVEQGHLSDYEVLVIAVSELYVANSLGVDALNLPNDAAAGGGGPVPCGSPSRRPSSCWGAGMRSRIRAPARPTGARQARSPLTDRKRAAPSRSPTGSRVRSVSSSTGTA